jgi:NAD(P)-dependent dehydrogenase (short-subunit alcohol dehydrogenase family)
MKTALVTGASYGIGEAIAKNLLQDGWKVYGLSRSRPELANESFVWIPCDLAKTETVGQALGAITEPKLDALVSNAGVISVKPASKTTRELYEHTFDVNVLAPMILVAALWDKIQAAAIVSVSSVSDRIAEAELSLYCSSKAANTLYFGSLARELKDARVYTLLPDYVDTPMLHGTMDDSTTFDWSTTIKPEDIASFTNDLVTGKTELKSGANIIIVTEALKEDLKPVEKLYGYNTDNKELTGL